MPLVATIRAAPNDRLGKFLTNSPLCATNGLGVFFVHPGEHVTARLVFRTDLEEINVLEPGV
jgi:hypothetical protein